MDLAVFRGDLACHLRDAHAEVFGRFQVGAGGARFGIHVRINAPLTSGVLHLAPLWPRFMARYPDVELQVSLIDRVVDIVE